MSRRRRRGRPEPGWAVAREALCRVLRERAGDDVTIETDRVRRFGRGLSRDAYETFAEVNPDPHGLSDHYAVFLPGRYADPDFDERVERETELLRRLAAMPLPFGVPRVLGTTVVDGERILVRTFETGVPLEMRADRARVVDGRPWDVVGRIAAAVHAIDVGSVTDLVPAHATRRGHAEARIAASFADLGPEVDDARAWADAHRPPPGERARFLHGDLLGQNILVGHAVLTGRDGPPALIDWEYARVGDPAYDLAIVTRGVRRPFGTGSGLRKLLRAYADAGGAPVRAVDVRLHELCMAAGWYRESLTGEGRHPPEEALARVWRVIEMAGADG